VVEKTGHSEDFVASRSVGGVDLQALANHLLEFLGVHGADGVVFARCHFGVESLHGSCSEGGLLHSHLVKDAASRPNITAEVIGHVLPDLRAGVVGSSSLSAEEASLADLRDVKVAEFNDSFLGQEQISTLNVSVADF